MNPKPKLPLLPKSLRDRLAMARRSLKSYSDSLREAQAEPTGSNTRRNRIIGANNEAISAAVDVLHLFRHTEHALATEPCYKPAPFIIPGTVCATEFDRAVADIRSIVADLEWNNPEHARATAVALLGRLSDTFGLPR